MLIAICLICSLICTPVQCAAAGSPRRIDWKIQQFFPNVKINRIRFQGHSVGWLAGDDGLLAQSDDGGHRWRRVQITGETSPLVDIAEADPRTIYVSTPGHLERSSDAGRTWARLSYGGALREDETIVGIVFVDAEHGFAVGAEGAVLVTTDGAKSWRRAPLMKTQGTNGVAQGGGKVWVVGDGGSVSVSANRGASWQARHKGNRNIFEVAVAPTGRVVIGDVDGNLDFSDDEGLTWTTGREGNQLTTLGLGFSGNIGWATDEKWFYTTRDFGQTWHQTTIPGAGEVWTAVFADARYGLAGDQNGVMFETSDGGSSWRRSDHNLQSVWVSDDGAAAWIAGQSGSLLSTRDGGGHWIDRPSPTKSSITLGFSDANHGWLITDEGRAFHTGDAGVHWRPAAPIAGLGIVDKGQPQFD